MFSVIEFLEKMGRDAQLRHASLDEVAKALEVAGVEAPLCTAILAKDAAELQALLHQGPLYCIQSTGTDDEESEKRKRQAAGEEDEQEGRKGDKTKGTQHSPTITA
ncbi:hypothetical protein [Dyella sp. Tek66A03]|jgi:hypothetical protein|uniref:hypothetical protein n=1 Tax=Dyella sp. Tek66A03 TaxID=3458298 RepID=UPI00403E6E22